MLHATFGPAPLWAALLKPPWRPVLNPTLDALNTRFGMADHLHFEDQTLGLPVAHISTPHGTARLSLYGGHVLSWQPTGQQPVIWVSPAAIYATGTAIRGGVPVCWPWFGSVAGKVSHGFARTSVWQVRGADVATDGAVTLRLGLQDDAHTRTLWPHAFDLELVVTVGSTLTLSLITRNTGDAPFTLTQALHTYFCVGDIHHTTVHGLEGTTYLDKPQNFAEFPQTGPITFSGEVDRVYINTVADCVIDDAAWGRRIRVAKSGSTSTVVWNPWAEREKAMVDMAPGDHIGMVCVETCNAGPDQIVVAPQAAHALVATFSLA